jgi:hypothetical protein
MRNIVVIITKIVTTTTFARSSKLTSMCLAKKRVHRKPHLLLHCECVPIVVALSYYKKKGGVGRWEELGPASPLLMGV